jgi:hypothetical protein
MKAKRKKRVLLLSAILCFGVCLGAPSGASAAGSPAWRLAAISLPTNVAQGTKGQIAVSVVNVGSATSSGPITVVDMLPPGLTPTATKGCSVVAPKVTCVINEKIGAGGSTVLTIPFEVGLSATGTLVNEAAVEGGGAAPVAMETPVTISGSVAPFGFLPSESGFSAPLTGPDGSAATQAGSHPYQLIIEVGFPSEKTSEILSAGAVRNVSTELPPGEIVDPNSTSKLCTEAQFVTRKCPDASQIGVATVTTTGAVNTDGSQGIGLGRSQIYNMVAVPGTPSTFGFDAAGVGIFTHITGELRSDGAYTLTGISREILARGANPILGARLALWGDPSDSGHDGQRGSCLGAHEEELCPAEEASKEALLTTPVQCTGQPTVTHGRTDSWEETGVFKTGSYESADLAGAPVAVNGCNQLQFEPTIEAKPTTNLADSPSGLEVDLHQPTNQDPGGTSPAIMKDLRLVLPEGMSVNPSSADGLGACTEAQANVHTLSPSACPSDSKLGDVEVVTPLLAHPLDGALYLAEPFKNPSGSLLALYLAIDDPSTGTVANLAGRVEADATTGQLTNVFEENPQLPISDIKAKLFTGPRAALRTPASCGTYTSTARMTPWSAPQTPDAEPSDSFEIAGAPDGGSCPSSLPNSPGFSAGTIAPQAAAYSPFLLKASRADGSQEMERIETTLAPGLVAKLAGVPYCSEADIAKAQARSNPNEGAIEKGDPSCPAASQVGTVDVGAGAGIAPIHVSGRAYLAGPYKGAPLSLVVITPAIAGPFDLGAVVVRTALMVDPTSAQVKAVSDPFPRILDGIPLDIRSIAIELARPEFTLNPTSCDPSAISGTLTSVLGSGAGVSSPFQVGGCPALGFKPKLAIKLTGGTTRSKNPALRATLTMPAAGANVAKASVALPHSEFLDQGHIRTICTRVQFAAAGGNGGGCPAGSVYGKARALTPLLAQPLEGPVFLRSNGGERLLPDLVAALHGQIDVDLVGKIDSVKGGIRTTFEGVPDAPVSKFVLEMQGGKKGLLENSTNLCKSINRATALFDGQNGKVHDFNPVVHNSCKKKGKKHHRGPKHAK